MLKDYLIKAYGYLVRVDVWKLEEKNEGKKVVPQEYRIAVAEYLATQGQSIITQ